MTQEQIARLSDLLERTPPITHAGRTVGRTLYSGDGPDDLIGVMDSRELAELVVLAVQYARYLLCVD